MPSTSTTAPQHYPPVVSVVNLKGGVGKTTLCVNLAYILAYAHAKRVLLIDLDPQANATQYLMSQHSYRKLYLNEPAQKLTVYELYHHRSMVGVAGAQTPSTDKYIQRVYQKGSSHLDLVASKLELSLHSFAASQYLSFNEIRDFIAEIPATYDLVFIDCPPTVSRLLMASLEASQYILVPVKLDFLSAIGLPLLKQVVSQIYPQQIARRPHWMPSDVKILGLVRNMYERQHNSTKESEAEVTALAKSEKYYVFDALISRSTKFTWGPRHSLPIFRTEPNSRYADEIRELGEEFLSRLQELETQRLRK